MDITPENARSLVGKLAALDLADGERALLDTVFVAAGGDEVSGFLDKSSPKNTGVTQGYTEVEWTYMKSIDGLMGGSSGRPGTKGWIDVLSVDW